MVDGLPPGVARKYAAIVADLQSQYQELDPTSPVRLAKPTSNLFRVRAEGARAGLDVSAVSGVLHVDPDRRFADVLGMTTYEELVDATLPYGLMPTVVPQLKTITLGGAVTGLGIESSSFREGMPHESVLEMDVLTGAGDVVTARPDGDNADLFFGFPNSYGTLGYSVRLRIELLPVHPFVELHHLRCHSAQEASQRIEQLADTRHWQDRSVDFLDGTVFSDDEIYLTVGSWADNAPYTSDYTGQHIYYKSIQRRARDFLTVRDYLWRWDTDWFWCSNGLGVQKPWVRPFIPRRYLRSDTYFRAVSFARRHDLINRWESLHRRPDREYVIQDIEVPVGRLAEFLDFFHREVGISPVWLCPLRQRNPESTWDLYVMRPGELYVNLGFWSSVPIAPGASDGDVNRAVEREVERLGGRKSLYSSSFYPEDEFWRIYNGQAYSALKKRYDPDSRLLDLYAKCVTGR